MFKWLLGLLLILSLVGVTGCFTTNVTHNRQHLKTWRQDLSELHEDIDFTILY